MFATDEVPDFVQEGFLFEVDQTTWTHAHELHAVAHRTTWRTPPTATAARCVDSPELTASVPAGISAGPQPPGVLTASAPITSRAEHSLFLSIFDEQDHTTNSDVLLDNLRFSQVVDPATQCVPRAPTRDHQCGAPIVPAASPSEPTDLVQRHLDPDRAGVLLPVAARQ